MVEGIPNYLGLIAVKKYSPEDLLGLLKMFQFMDKKGSQTPLANRLFGGGDDYIKAYYQGPLALYKLGELIGHDNLVQLISEIFNQDSNPDHKSFETLFLMNGNQLGACNF